MGIHLQQCLFVEHTFCTPMTYPIRVPQSGPLDYEAISCYNLYKNKSQLN